MQDLTESVKQLAGLIREFKFYEALDRFYSEDIVTIENENPPTVGLPAYRLGAKTYLESISNASAELMNVIVSDGITVMEWRYKFDHKKWGKWDKVQISVQRWRDGKIVHERHHYSP
jgi:hypothetical protein